MKKLLLVGGALAAAVAVSKRRKDSARTDSARLWSEAVAQPLSPVTASSVPPDRTD